MDIAFTKMSGSGNDFVIIDNRQPVLDPDTKRDFVRRVCQPKLSVGADGVIFIENSDTADYKWDFYNNDGSSAEMCGNGGRCVARYAFEKGIAPREHSFETVAGIISAEVNGPMVKVRLTEPFDLRENVEVAFDGQRYQVDHINTGVPHAIVFSQDVDGEDVQKIGHGIRYHTIFAPAGTNVDLVEKQNGGLKVRTYERGVEGETLACGTGVVASALIAARRFEIQSPVSVHTRGGEILKVHIGPSNGASQPEVFLEGLTKIAFEGHLVEL